MLNMDQKNTHFGGPGDTKIMKSVNKIPTEKHLKNEYEKYVKM